MKPRIEAYLDPLVLAEALAERVVNVAAEAVRARRTCHIALSGGSTPETLYRLLGNSEDFPWQTTTFWLVDERFVPQGHSDHNGVMIRDALDRPDARLVLVDTEGNGDAAGAALAYGERIKAAVPSEGVWPVFDLILLGLGTDGHTASLFPGTGAVDIEDRVCLDCMPLTASHRRISLSLPVILQGRTLFFLAAGSSKSAMIGRVAKELDTTLPAGLVTARALARGTPVEFWLDRAAAASLG